MSILDSIRGFVNLAANRPKGLEKEIGKRSNTSKEYNEEEIRVDSLDLVDYRQMWRNDGKVAALLRLYTLPIIGADVEIIPEEGGEKEAQFIKDNLLQPTFKGGLATPIRQVVEDMCYAPFEGFRAFEKVWFVDEGKIKLRKLASRDTLSVRCVTNDKGELTYLRQHLDNEAVDIPADKVVLVTFNSVVDPYYGESILKPAWYHYDKKHKLYYISHVAAEVQTVPPRILKHNNMDPGQRAQLEEALDRLGLESRITYNSNQAEIEFLDTGSGSKINIKEMIDHHDSQMSKALLAMWIDLSSESGSTGSRALADPMMDLYLKNVESFMNIIEDAFNYQVIPQLIEWNFGENAKYPKFTFGTIRKDTEQVIFDVFNEFARNGSIPQEMVDRLTKEMADKLGIQYDEEEILTNRELARQREADQMEAQRQSKEEEKPVAMTEKRHIPHVHSHDVDHQHQELTPVLLAELSEGTKIDLQDMAKKLPRFERGMQTAAEDVLLKVQDRITEQVQNIIEVKDYSAVKDLRIGLKEDYAQAIETVANEVYNYSKTKVSEEMRIDTPATLSAAKEKIEAIIDNSVQRQYSALQTEVGALALAGIEAAWSPQQVEAAIASEFTGFNIDDLVKAIPVLIYEIFNMARGDVFEQNKDLITAYRYRNDLENIMRGVVCPYCQSLNGMTVDALDDSFFEYHPPQHFNCACMWEPIMPGERYTLTGAPTELPVYDTIDQFKQIDRSEVNKVRESINLPKVKLSELDDSVLEAAQQLLEDVSEKDEVSKAELELSEVKKEKEQLEKLISEVEVYNEEDVTSSSDKRGAKEAR